MEFENKSSKSNYKSKLKNRQDNKKKEELYKLNNSSDEDDGISIISDEDDNFISEYFRSKEKMPKKIDKISKNNA